LVDQLTQAIDVNATEMVMMHRFLLRELIGNESPKATQRLIELATDIRTSPALLQDVRVGLAARRNGADYMLAALEKRYDYLKGVLAPPPVGPLADALAAMAEGRAAPLLAAHLNDPADSADDVKRAALALVTIATAAEMDDLRTFFALYRATAHDDELVEAVVAVAKALLRVGGRDGRALVESAATDPMTVPSLRVPLSELIRAPAPAPG
jgi:outer membrane protein assembly factor BamB